MKNIFFVLLALMFSISSFAIESMSPAEMEIREAHDRISKELFKCYAINDYDPRNIDDSVCQKEQQAAKLSGENFNNFMEMKRAKEDEIPYKIRRQRYKDFLEQYVSYTEKELEELHKTHCHTKWGSSGSSECNAIGQQRAEKTYQRLSFKNKN